MPICYKCNTEKEQDMFVKDKYTLSGYKNLCKECARVASKEYHGKNKEKRAADHREWLNKNKEYWADYCKFRRGTNPDFQHKGRQEKRTREEARQHAKERKTAYDMENQKEIRQYREENKERDNATRRNWRKEKSKTDLSYKITCSLRSRLVSIMRERKTKKSDSTKNLLGCSLEYFISWLESHFLLNMGWHNYGFGDDKWNIDHHYPCAMFDMTDPEQQKQCFHYTNLFPLWQTDNNKKWDTIPEPRDYQI